MEVIRRSSAPTIKPSASPLSRRVKANVINTVTVPMSAQGRRSANAVWPSGPIVSVLKKKLMVGTLIQLVIKD